MENPMKMDDFGGTTISGNIHLKRREESHLTRVTHVLIHVSRFIPNLHEIHISNWFGENVGFTAWLREISRILLISSGVVHGVHVSFKVSL